MLKVRELVFLVLIVVIAAPEAWGGTYWIDFTNGTTNGGCGTGPGSRACKTYASLITVGCDSNGCANNIQSDLSLAGTNATVNFSCKNGGGACTGVETYAGNGAGKPLCFGFDGRATSELTVQCVDGTGKYSPLGCKISGASLTYQPQWAVVLFGGSAATCIDDATSYVTFRGFRIEDIPSASSPSAIRTRAANPNHIKIADCRIDGGTTASADLMLALAGSNYITYVNNTFANCAPVGTFGCVGFQQPNSHLAAVGNHFGPRRDFPGPYNGGAGSNLDCHTWQGTTRGLIDGNECFKTADGLDNGMLDINKIQDIIVRYNDLHDVHGNPNLLGSRLAKVSGDAGSGTATGSLIFYKNVFRHTNPAYWDGALWATELARDIDWWYNTMYGAQHKLDDSTIQYFALDGAAGSTNARAFFNLFDGTTTGKLSGPCANSNGQTCPLWDVGSPNCTAAECKWVGNRLWFAERGATAPCIRQYLAGTSDMTFNCDLTRVGGGAGFNSTGANTLNLRADPHFVARGGTNLSDYALTSASSGYRDTGQAFCTATGTGSGNTINVTCQGISTDPRHYFPQPSDYYDLANSDCKGAGVRVADGPNPGCYDIRIEGACGVREVTSMTASSITFAGPACSWSQGAMVHVPWDGIAPDIGAFEFGTGAGPAAPVLLEVTPTAGS